MINSKYNDMNLKIRLYTIRLVKLFNINAIIMQLDQYWTESWKEKYYEAGLGRGGLMEQKSIWKTQECRIGRIQYNTKKKGMLQ